MRLIIDNLTVKRGERAVLSGVTCTVDAGQTLVLTGPNGAGKTTLIRSIAGFLAAASGTVTLEGGDLELDVGQQCHHVGHSNGVKPSLTVAENLSFWAEFLGDDTGPADSVVACALDELGLEAISQIEAAYLSAGQKRRTGLARLLVAYRPVWLLDEPTVSLDVASAAAVAALVNRHTSKGGIAVVATHLPMPLERAIALDLQSPALRAGA